MIGTLLARELTLSTTHIHIKGADQIVTLRIIVAVHHQSADIYQILTGNPLDPLKFSDIKSVNTRIMYSTPELNPDQHRGILLDARG